jgi:rare lipoprotein A
MERGRIIHRKKLGTLLAPIALTEDEVCGKGNKPIVQHQAMESPVKRIFFLLNDEPVFSEFFFVSRNNSLCVTWVAWCMVGLLLATNTLPMLANKHRSRTAIDKKVLPPPTLIIRTPVKPTPRASAPMIVQHSMKQAFAIEASNHAESALTQRKNKTAEQTTTKSSSVSAKRSGKHTERTLALEKAGVAIRTMASAETVLADNTENNTRTIYRENETYSRTQQPIKQPLSRFHFIGEASFYAGEFLGRNTSNGELYHGEDLTAAHRELPFGALVQVKNLKNGRTIVVRINDRGPFKMTRVIDLSPTAADSLGMVRDGIAQVECTVLRDKCSVQFAQMR